MIRALLIGKEPVCPLDYEYVREEPYDVVVIGSLSIGQLLRFVDERVLEALANGKSVFLYTPGLPEVPKNRSAARRELKSWGVVFTDGGRRRLITAEEARMLRRKGQAPGPGAVLTPLAKEVLEGSE